ncbi:MAG: hypothetical protein IJH34_13645 [Romboutsia sp.]|nr:hypothetical protein [Romboutsia sp.]
MKTSIIALLLISTVGLVACSNNNTQNKTTTQNNNNKITNQEQNKSTNTNLSNEDYKDIIVKNYEKYIKPIDIQDENLDDLLDEDNKSDNNEIFENYKSLLDDSKNNISSFMNSIKDLKIEDDTLQDLNNTLVDVSDELVNDINEAQNYLDKNKTTILNKSKDDLIDYLEKNIDENLVSENSFEDTLDQIEDKLGINLDK